MAELNFFRELMIDRSMVLSLAEAGFAMPCNGPATQVSNAMARDWRKLLVQTYGLQAFRVCWSIFRRDIRLADLARVAPHADEWTARVKDAPRLAPLLLPLARVLNGPPADLQTLRDSLLRRGLTPAAWKWMCRQPTEANRKLFTWGATPEAIFWANLLSRAKPEGLDARWFEPGRPYQMAQHARVYGESGVPGGDFAQQMERFFRLLPSSNTPQVFREYEILAYGLLLTVFSAECHLRIHSGVRWDTLLDRMRRYNQLRMSKADGAQEDARNAATWRGRLGEVELLGVKVRELTSTLDLIREGIVLDHCVGNGVYAAACTRGDTVLVSLEEQVAGLRGTLQLVRNDKAGGWLIAQLAGAGNSPLPPKFWQVSREVQASLSV